MLSRSCHLLSVPRGAACGNDFSSQIKTLCNCDFNDRVQQRVWPDRDFGRCILDLLRHLVGDELELQ